MSESELNLDRQELSYYSPKVDKWYHRPLHSKLKVPLRQRIKEIKTGSLFEYSNVKNMGKAFSRYLEDIKLNSKGYVLTTFRKDFISRSQESGIPLSATSLLAGHSKISTTMEYYTTLSPEYLRGELNKLD